MKTNGSSLQKLFSKQCTVSWVMQFLPKQNEVPQINVSRSIYRMRVNGKLSDLTVSFQHLFIRWGGMKYLVSFGTRLTDLESLENLSMILPPPLDRSQGRPIALAARFDQRGLVVLQAFVFLAIRAG